MIMPLLYGFIFIILFILYIYLWKKKRKLPLGVKEAPIEAGLPIIGILYKIKPPIYHYLWNLGKKYGSIFRIYLGMREVFVLNDYEALKKCFREDNENFSGRWNGKYIRMVMENSGIIMIDGEVWAEQRSFMLKTLRDFGLGKSRTDDIVQNECKNLICNIMQKENQNIDFLEIINVHTMNIISEFLMKKSYTAQDEDAELIRAFIKKILSKQNLLQMFHIMCLQWDNSEICSKISYKLFFLNKEFLKIKNIFNEEIIKHEKLLYEKTEAEDYMDRFLLEQAKLKEKNGLVGSFTKNHLIRNSFEMFSAGFDSTSGSLVWSLFFLAKYPLVQQRMHLEIISFLGKDEMVSSNNRKRLPYTQAVMDEVLRLGSVAPLAVFHRNYRDTIINNIFIPKDSFILPNLYACHRDGSIWERPFEFYPEHFLSISDGEIKYKPREHLVPFSMGKRQCLGESLARAEIFIFLTSIIQKFRVLLTKEMEEEAFQKVLLGDEAPARYCKIKNFIFVRHSDTTFYN